MKKKAKVIGTIRLGLLLALVLAMLIPSLVVRAEAPDWIQGEISGTRDETASPYSLYGDCSDQLVRVGRLYNTYQERNACVYLAKSFRYALIDGTLHISSGIDTDMYPLVDVGFASRSRILPSPESDDFIYGTLISRDFLNKISLVTDAPAKHYVQNQDFSYNFAQDEQGSVSYAPQGSAISRNGRWLIVNFQNVGLVRYHLTDMSVTRIASYSSGLSFLSISNDGRYIAETASATNYQPVIYDTQDCGQSASTLQSEWNNANFSNSCQSRSLSGDVNNILQTSGSNTYERPAFSDDDGQLVIYSFPHGGSGAIKVTLNAPKYATEPRLDYLALGDSFSSGEGDIDDEGAWYLEGTEKQFSCHISKRAYPYLLRNDWEINDDKMKSIACSGAKVRPDYYNTGDNAEYLGQIEVLKDKSTQDRQQMRDEALNDFMPGIVQQIDFVEKYKPKTLTLTAGGNDVGFGSILAYCASPMEIESSGSLEGYTTCAHANDPQIAANLRKTIDDIRQPLTNLINTIKELSPQTKVYLIGYPQFVAQDGCIQGSIFLDLLERNMIRSSVSRLNNILKLVASDTDTYYVSIEDSLEGGQICQGSRYMTGPLQIFGKIIDGYSQEAYHPNAKGHEKIAQEISRRIKEEDMSYTIIDIPVEENGQRVIKKAVTKNYMGVGSTYTVEMGPGIFNPDGTIDIVKFSKKIHLGTYKANADGSLRAAITIPQDAELGNHLLTLTGTSTKGDTVQVQQFITIYDDKAAIVNEANTDKTKQTSLVNDNYVAAQPIFASDMNTAQLKPVENLELRNDSTDLSSTGKLDNSIWPNNSLLVIGLVSAILTLLGATLYAKKTSKKPS